jgi:peptidoglycan/LPS O-acetylase OafA/YrhL
MQQKRGFEAIDFLKGFSMLTIVIYHLLQRVQLSTLLEKLIAFGGTGVHTFMMLSGFGLYHSHLKNELHYGQFLNKRFSKIYTPYVIVVALSVLIALVYPIYKYDPYYTPDWYAFFGHVFFYKMFDESIMGTYGYQFWFVSIIFQLYLLFVPLSALKKRLSDNIFILVGLTITMIWIGIVLFAGKQDLRTWNSFFPQYLWEFMLGMVMAKWAASGKYFWNMPIKYLIPISLLGMALYAALALKFGSIGKLTNDIPALFGYTGFALLLYRLQINRFNRFVLFAGDRSYSLFLTHFLIQILVFYTAEKMQISLKWLLLPIFMLQLLVAYYFEKLTPYLHFVKSKESKIA